MTNLLAVEMDCFSDDCVDQDGSLNLAAMTANIKASAAKFKVRATLTNECGPGGGCPVYSFVGTEPDLKAYLKVWHNPGLSGTDLEEEINFYLSTAKPA